MRTIDKEYTDCIKVPDLENGLTKKNAEYFDFPDSQFQLLGKHSMLLICCEVILFVIWLRMQNSQANNVLFMALTVVLAGVAFWYQYQCRYVRFYKKARKGAKSCAIEYTVKLINKIVESKTTYFKDMPLIYTVLKAKALLEQNKVVETEVLVENALKYHSKCFEAWYVKGLCAYASGEEDDVAFERLSYVSLQKNVSEEMKNCAKKLAAEIKEKNPSIEAIAVGSAEKALKKQETETQNILSKVKKKKRVLLPN